MYIQSTLTREDLRWTICVSAMGQVIHRLYHDQRMEAPEVDYMCVSCGADCININTREDLRLTAQDRSHKDCINISTKDLGWTRRSHH